MKRVLFVDQSQVLGGAELSLIDIAKEFPDSVVAVFAAGEFSNRLAELEIDHRILNVPRSLTDVKRSGGIISEVLAAPALLSTALNISRVAKDFDIIYANTQKAMIASAIGGAWSGKPVVWHLRDLMTSDHFGQKIIRISVSVANRFVDRIIANSNATNDAFVNAGGNANKTVTIHNGIDAGPFVNLDNATGKLRQELNLGDTKVAGIFSRISDWKGQHLLIEALVDRVEWTALIVGDSLFQNDHEYKQHLENLVAKNDLASRVKFLGFRNDIPQLMAACDTVVHASTSPEPFGRVIIEGMLAKSTVVAANAGGAKEIVRDGENGFLFDPEIPQSLGVVLDSLVDDLHRTEIIDAAYEEAVNYYSVKRMVREIATAVDSLEGSR